jgi:Holliday junction resolvase RusA-like endonuclease
MPLDKPIKFTIPGKPPKKSKWGNDNNAKLIITLREAALKARKEAGYSDYIDTNVNLKLTVYAPNIADLEYRQTGDFDEKRPVGDLDALISGVCDSLWAGPIPGVNKFKPSSLFEDHPDVGPGKPIIIKDDSQIVSISATKEVCEDSSYTVEIL